MQIKLAKEMGMCFGVRDTLKAIDRAGRTRARIDTLGTLVHNPQLVDKLSTQGVEVVDSLDSVKAPTVAVTAHGAAPEVYRNAQQAGFELIDTTCPLVTRVQQLAKTLMEEGSWVIVYGDAPHPEVKGILGWANSVFDEDERPSGVQGSSPAGVAGVSPDPLTSPTEGVQGRSPAGAAGVSPDSSPSSSAQGVQGSSPAGVAGVSPASSSPSPADRPKKKIKPWAARRAICAKSVEEIEAALAAAGTPDAKVRKIALVSQTTQNTEWYKAFARDVITRFLEHGCEVHVHNTICLPTAKRQPAAEELAKEVDLMIVVGGYESANTRHLRDIAAEFCPAYHIERPEQIEEEWLRGAKTVGVTAGASTPDYVIQQVVEALEEMGERIEAGAKA